METQALNQLMAMNVSTEKSASTNALYCGDLNYGWYQNYWQPEIVHHYYPWYSGTTVIQKDTYAIAFRIAKFLLKEKLLASTKVVDFIALVEKIAAMM